jgi:hypothetical protein
MEETLCYSMSQCGRPGTLAVHWQDDTVELPASICPWHLSSGEILHVLVFPPIAGLQKETLAGGPSRAKGMPSLFL